MHGVDGMMVMHDEVDGAMTGVTVMDRVDGMMVVGNGLDGVVHNGVSTLVLHLVHLLSPSFSPTEQNWQTNNEQIEYL